MDGAQTDNTSQWSEETQVDAFLAKPKVRNMRLWNKEAEAFNNDNEVSKKENKRKAENTKKDKYADLWMQNLAEKR